jgi:curved DNA-binding protein
MSAAPSRIDSDRRLLGVAASVDADALRRAYRRAVKQVHPDRVGGDGERLRAVIEAFHRLEAVAPAVADVAAEVMAEVEAEPARMEITTAQAVIGGWTVVETADGQALSVRLPAGLRVGEVVRVSGVTFRVTIARSGGASVAGDNLLMTAEVGRALLADGGRLVVRTPAGETAVWVSRGDGALGFVRLAGRGLPARGARPAGDLILRLKPAPGCGFDTPLQAKRRRFAQAWAA